MKMLTAAARILQQLLLQKATQIVVAMNGENGYGLGMENKRANKMDAHYPALGNLTRAKMQANLRQIVRESQPQDLMDAIVAEWPSRFGQVVTAARLYAAAQAVEELK
jgi:hypothetical protein